jgi:hypothetical protein
MTYSFPFQSNKEAKIAYDELNAPSRTPIAEDKDFWNWTERERLRRSEMGVFWNNKLGNITQEESDLLMTANSPRTYQEIMEELKRRREMNQPREFKASGSLSGTPEQRERLL